MGDRFTSSSRPQSASIAFDRAPPLRTRRRARVTRMPWVFTCLAFFVGLLIGLAI